MGPLPLFFLRLSNVLFLTWSLTPGGSASCRLCLVVDEAYPGCDLSNCECQAQENFSLWPGGVEASV